MKAVVTRPTSLSLAPAAFAPELWQEFCILFPTEEKARESLGTGPMLWLAGAAASDLLRKGYVSDDDTRQIQRGAISDQIVQMFRDMLLSGRLVATGMPPPRMDRLEIPACLWSDLEFDFPRSSAENPDYKFTYIEVTLGEGTSDTRLADCKAWLEGQPRQVKKAMAAAAFAQFPGLTTREYNAAFAAAYDTKAGRPQKTSII